MNKPKRSDDKYWTGTRRFDDIQFISDLEDYIFSLEERIEALPIHDFSYCVEQTRNVLTNKFCNIAKEHLGKTFDEVPEATDLLKAIDVIEKHCS